VKTESPKKKAEEREVDEAGRRGTAAGGYRTSQISPAAGQTVFEE
jgi:hypothetical protein